MKEFGFSVGRKAHLALPKAMLIAKAAIATDRS
jgi:hypothetical protein